MFNEIEEKLTGSLMDYDRKNPKEVYTMIYSDGTEIRAVYGTDYESDNCLGDDDENYEEYWGIAYELKEVIKDCGSVPCKIGGLFEVNYINFPYIVKNSEGDIIVENI